MLGRLGGRGVAVSGLEVLQGRAGAQQALERWMVLEHRRAGLEGQTTCQYTDLPNVKAITFAQLKSIKYE